MSSFFIIFIHERFACLGNISMIAVSLWMQGKNVSSQVFMIFTSMLGWVGGIFYFSCKHVMCFKYNVCVVGHETVTEFLSELHCRSCAAFNSTTPRSAYRDLLNVFKRCELCLRVSVWLTEMGLSTETQSWMGFSKYNIFTQCWWLHGFFSFIHKTFLGLGSHLFSYLNRWSGGEV